MLASCVRAELVKLRRSPIWLVFVALPGISALIGCANYQGNLGVITPGWSNLWTQQTLFVCYFFLPALLGAGCSFLWRQEHQGSNWNELMVQPVPIRDLVLAKFCVGALMSALAFTSILAFYVASGVVLGVPGEFPAARIAEYVTLGVLGSLVVVAIQLDISMVRRAGGHSARGRRVGRHRHRRRVRERLALLPAPDRHELERARRPVRHRRHPGRGLLGRVRIARHRVGVPMALATGRRRDDVS